MVKPGYKQTEIGVIPEDWEISKLGNIGQFKNGINKDKDKFGYGVPIIGLMDVFGMNHINSTSNSGLVEASPYEQEDYSLKEGDVLFVRSSVKPAGVGLTAVVEQTLQNAVFSGFLLRYRTEKMTVGFKRYVFYASYFRENLIAASTVSANTNINQDSLKQLVLAYPTNEAEQNKIAQTISSIDALLLSLEKQISKKKAIKQGAMQELLTGKKRLPGFSDKWKQRSFSDACEICARMVDPTQTEYANLPHIGNESIEKFTGRITHYNKVKEDQLISGKYLFGSNDVLYGKINPHFAKAAFPMFEGLCSADMYPISCKEDILPEYLLYILLSTEFTNYTVSLSKRSGIPKVNRDELADYMMLLPSVDEQKEIANVLCGMDLEIHSLIQKLTKYRQVKQGMMQQLLTGKIRLV